MKLLVDIGNTVIKAATCEGMTFEKTFRYQGENHTDWIISLIEQYHLSSIAISSEKELYIEDISRLKSSCADLIIVDPAHKGDIYEKFSLPEHITPSCAMEVVAARHLFKDRACGIFDFGTVINYSFINADGSWNAGYIAPGCTTRFRSISRYARNLPLLDRTDEMQFAGNTVNSSIRGGVISGIVFEIEGYMSEYPQNMFIFTGGDAFYFAKRTKKPIFVVSNMVLTGLALIAEDEVFE